jgi:serine/threonine protein kinase
MSVVADYNSDALMDALLYDQYQRWNSGSPLPVEDYLAARPELNQMPDHLMDLIHGEWRSSHEAEHPISITQLQSRFPRFQVELARHAELMNWWDESHTTTDDLSTMIVKVESTLADHPVTTHAPDIWSTWTLNDFEIEQEAGRGGMGVVNRAKQKGLDRDVALKFIKAEFHDQPAVRQRFLREAKIAARVSHPYIVSLYGVGQTADEKLFLVMEWISGPNFAQVLKTQRPDLETVLDFLIKVTEALGCLHRQGIIHRDLKPSNILLTEDGNPMLTDFGLAHLTLTNADQQLTGNQILGTPGCLAPEQIDRNWGAVSPATDLYSLGALLHLIFSGKTPFHDSNPLTMLMRTNSADKAPSLGSVTSDLPPALIELCDQCLEKTPALRPQDASTVALRLRSIRQHLLHSPRTESHLPAPSPQFIPHVKRNQGLIGYLPVFVLISTGFFISGMYLWSWTNSGIHAKQTEVAPTAPQLIAAQWEVQLFSHADSRQATDLLKHPRLPKVGESLRIKVVSPESGPLQLYWVDSTGKVQALDLFDSFHASPNSISWPQIVNESMHLLEPAGLETAVMIQWPKDSTPHDLSQQLQPDKPFPPIDNAIALINGNPLIANQDFVASDTLQLLKSTTSRPVSEPQKLQVQSTEMALEAWRQQLKLPPVTMSYLTLNVQSNSTED